MIVWPTQNMTFKDWADSLRLTRKDLRINPIVIDEKKWQYWAFQILQNKQCQTANAPQPNEYPSWREWAMRFINAFGSSGSSQ